MSTVKDSQGNILNNPGPGCGRYTDANATEIDWFATHPRPVEKAKTEFHITEVPATLPPNSGETLTVVPIPEGTHETPDGVLVYDKLNSAGVTTSSLPQATVTA